MDPNAVWFGSELRIAACGAAYDYKYIYQRNQILRGPQHTQTARATAFRHLTALKTAGHKFGETETSKIQKQRVKRPPKSHEVPCKTMDLGSEIHGESTTKVCMEKYSSCITYSMVEKLYFDCSMELWRIVHRNAQGVNLKKLPKSFWT